MSQKRVDKLEAKTRRRNVYLGGHGLRVQVNGGHNTWGQVVTSWSGRQTTMKLGQTRRISFVDAQTIGSMLKDWAKEHTVDDCRAASGEFRELARTDVDKRGRISLGELESAWYGAIGDRRRAVDRELLASLRGDKAHGGGGEGPEHERLKEHVKRTPSVLGLSDAATAESEYRLASHDSVDVMFCFNGEMVCVEVKSKISDAADIRRGIFQCIKYQAVTEAMLKAESNDPNVRSVLVLGCRLSPELKATAEKTGVKVIENVKGS